MKTTTVKETKEIVDAARIAVEPVDDFWQRLGQYFRDRRKAVEPRPNRESK